MSADRKPGYLAVIPARVRYDPELPDKAKLLYGELTALADRDGFCWARNEYFCQLYDISDRTVYRLLSALRERRHIFVETLRDEASQAVMERRIWVDRGKYLMRDRDMPPVTDLSGPPDKIVTTPPDKNVRTPPDKNVRENDYKSMNDTREEQAPLKSPHGGTAGPKARRGRRSGPREAPDWEPERFAGFWAFYPVKKAKQKAMDEWDRLRPDKELIDVIARSLILLKATEDWQRGIGIPHPSTFLHQARWTDAEGLRDPREKEQLEEVPQW